MEKELETVNLDDVLNNVLSLYRKRIEDTHAVVKTSDLPTLQSYKTPLHQVFQNLIGNALKYHENGTPPIVEISCEDKKSAWQFAVKDNGIGISNEYFEKIFVVFKRLHSSDSYSGTGMGLSICKKIIERMGGRIWVESQNGEGCTFYFTLPKEG
ncbi:MAG: ATP-binding protein [Ferruginibacter sp.]